MSSPKADNEEKKVTLEDLDFKIENVVATVTVEIKEKLDLVKISREIIDVEYNPERFPGIIMRIDEPKSTFLIFSTGKMVLTGLKRAIEAEAATEEAVKKIKDAGIDIANPQVTIVNFVASGNLHMNIDLNMAALVMEYAMYEPEVFPGLIYRMQDPKAVFLIFSTGKIVCTGVKNEESVKEAILNLHAEVQKLDLTIDEYGKDYQKFSFI